MTNYVAALDLGGTKIAGAIVDQEGRIVSERVIETEADQGPEHVISRMVDLIRGFDTPVRALGVASPGPLSTREGVILQPPNLPGWTRIPIVDQLRAALGVPVWLENDANAAALGEARYGAGRGAENSVYVTISTGIGAGIVINGHLPQPDHIF